VTTAEIEGWLLNRLAAEFDLSSEAATPDLDPRELGIDSVKGVELISELSDRLQVEIEPTAVWDYPSVRELARAIASGAALQ
jgi:acyl carrier protein